MKNSDIHSLCKQRAIYLDGKLSLAHARCTDLSQMIKSTNNLHFCQRFKHLYSLKIINISKNE